MLQTSIVGEVKTTATIVDTKINDNPSFFNQMNGSGMVEDLQSIPESLNSSTDSLKENTALLKEFGNIMPEMIKNLRAMNDAVVRNTQNLPALSNVRNHKGQRINQIDEYSRQNLMQLVNSGSNAVQSIAGGNVSGAIFTGVNSVTNTTNNLAKMASAGDMASLAKGLIAGGVVTAIVGATLKGGDALANKFIEEMPIVYGTGRAFGMTSDDDALRAYHTINNYNKGTGLDIETFQGIAQSLRKQGVANDLLSETAQLAQVGNIARTTSRWAKYSGGDANQYANLAGIMSRYGGSEDVANDFNYIMSAGLASGLNRDQLPEFLSGIQKVMEDGIAKGFSRSATEVADTMLMFSKMSGGNAFWQGEQGAKVINQASNGLASATALSKTSDILAYRAISRAYSGVDKNGVTDAEKVLNKDGLYLKDGNYVNNMMLMEKGLNANNFGYIMGAIGETSSSTEGQIERLRQMFGVNYTGATRLLKLYQDNGGKVTNAQIEKITKAPENQNKETQYQEAVNEIKDAVVRIGSKAADIKIEGMKIGADGVQSLVNHFVGGTNTAMGFGNEAINNTPNVTVSTGNDGLTADDLKFGFKAQAGDADVPYYTRSNKSGIDTYLRGFYGEKILDLAGGDENKANEFLEKIFNSKNNTDVKNLRGVVDWETSDRKSMKAERDDESDLHATYWIKKLDQ